VEVNIHPPPHGPKGHGEGDPEEWGDPPDPNGMVAEKLWQGERCAPYSEQGEIIFRAGKAFEGSFPPLRNSTL